MPSDCLSDMLSKSNEGLSAFTKVVKTHFLSKFSYHSLFLVSGQSAVNFTNCNAQVSPAHFTQRGGSLAAGGGIGETRTRATDDVTCSVSYEPAPPLAPNCSLADVLFLFFCLIFFTKLQILTNVSKYSVSNIFVKPY